MSLATQYRRASIAASCLLEALSELRRSKRGLRRQRDLNAMLTSLEQQRPRPSARRPSSAQLARGARRATAILGPRVDACVPRSLTLFALLCRHDYAASFVSGVAREAEALTSHAWVTVDGRLQASGSGDGRVDSYRETFRHDSRARCAQLTADEGQTAECLP